MDELTKVLQDNLNEEFLLAVLSNPKDKAGAIKVKVRAVKEKGQLLFQIEMFRNNQVFHENLNAESTVGRLTEYMENFRQMQLETGTALYSVLVSKKGKITIKKKQNVSPRSVDAFSHNRQKHYVLKEGEPVPFLIDLGVMTKEGKIVHSKFDKFRQMNRFLEFIEDISPQLPKNREVTVLDFGCGKSYLTFAMYYYLHELAFRYGYEKLAFLKGNIADYTGAQKVDMVVTLHACDTATDLALEKAVGWDAKVILSVPCCQHELNAQMQGAEQCKDNRLLALEPVMKYGLLKERMAALITDGLRAQYLERAGYHVQVLEFIDMEHTPKNIMIRAVKTENAERRRRAEESIKACEEFLHISPAIGRLLGR